MHLFVADDLDLPDLRNALQELPADAYGQAFIETEQSRHDDLERPAGISVTWLLREWISESVGRVFPEAWEAFNSASGRQPGQRLLDAYLERLTDPNPQVRTAAALAWCLWEDAHMSIPGGAVASLAERDPQFREVYALQVAYSWANNAFLGEHGIMDNLNRISHLPAVLIHGRQDISGPVATAWQLHTQWPGSELHIFEHEGHGGKEMGAAIGQAYIDLLPMVQRSSAP